MKNPLSSARRALAAAAVLIAVLAPVVGRAQTDAAKIPGQISTALKKAQAGIDWIVAVPNAKRDFDNTLGALDRVLARLDRETSLTLFMQFVSTDPAVRDAARAADEEVSNWTIALGKNEALYKAVNAYAATNPKLQGEEKRLLEHTLRDYRRAGMDLTPEKRDHLQAIEVELNKLSIEFDQNIAEDETKVACTADELKGLPADVLGRLPRSGDLYLVGMDGPTYGAAQEFCENGETRHKLYIAHKRRGGTRNIRILEKLIKLRAEAAQLLGYKNRVDYEVETRMAKNSETVRKFYDDLIPVVKKKADQDQAELLEVKRKHTGDPNAVLNVWDYTYYKGVLLKEKYAVDSEKVAEYFPMESVVQGIFDITSKLYGIEYRDVTSKASELGMPIWHPDVKLYEVWDKQTGKLLGRLYTDLYPREAKYNHAACWGLQPREEASSPEVHLPLAALVCNFTKPTPDKPSLLPHDEVETFFHEFGHGLHNILTNVKYASFSGTAVARDFVEAPSQMMENWVWNRDVLKAFTKHYKTGEPIPDDLLDGMLAARNVGSGIETEFQLFLGEMDQAYHTVPSGDVDTTKVMFEVFEKTLPYQRVPGTFYQASFGHLTGYQGAYYGYLWSLVYAQDMWQRFEELGVLNPEAGRYYREKILAKGGTEDEMDMLKDYLGREPKMDAFLKHLGLGGG